MTRRQRRTQRAGHLSPKSTRTPAAAPPEPALIPLKDTCELAPDTLDVAQKPPQLPDRVPDKAAPLLNSTAVVPDAATNALNGVEHHELEPIPAVPLPTPAPESSADAQPAVRNQPRSRLRRRLIQVAALCVGLALIGGVLVVRKLRPTAAPTPVPVVLSGTLPIDVVQQAHVGDAVTVTVGPAAATDGMPAMLVMLGSYGPQIYRATFASGSARFLIPGDDTQHSGVASLIVTAGAARGAAALTLDPDAPADPVTPLVGPRSISADTQHWSMSVAVPFDRFGNPVADGTAVDFRALHPGDQLELQHAQVRNMVAWARIFSRTRAGRSTVTVTAGGKSGPEATFTEVPGWPEPFGLSASPQDVPADGRQLVTLRTDVMRDYFGNAMLDGTLVTFVVDTPQGQPRMIPAYTIDGVAKTQLQAPYEPGQLTVRAVIYNAESRPLTITFATGIAVSSFPVAAHVNAADQSIDLIAGPMLGPLQQFIPDGTPVQFLLTDAVGQQSRVTAIAANGYAQATARLAALPFGAYTAEVKVGAGSGKATFQVP